MLDSVDAILGFARSMTWKGKHPGVTLLETTYAIGVKLSQKAMQAVEAQVRRLPGLDKWFVEIRPDTVVNGTI